MVPYEFDCSSFHFLGAKSMKKFGSLAVMLLLTTLMIFSVTLVLADSTYNESVTGDLSGDQSAPTVWDLTVGHNILTATSVAGDVEYVTVNIPFGMQLEALMLESYISTDDLAFIAVQTGTTFTESPTSANPANLLGYAHFGTQQNQVGTDILDDMGQGSGAIGFSGPLQGRHYTFWIQEAGPAPVTYTLNFVVAPSNTTGLYDEATDGDLSGDRLSPTQLTLVDGGNTLTATSVRGDVEYVTVTVPDNRKLEAILLSSYDSTDGVAFAAFQAGMTFTEPVTPSSIILSNLLGYSHFGTDSNRIGEDILDNLRETPGSAMFGASLPAGTYTFWLQQTGVTTTTYALNFVTSPDLSQTLFLPLILR